MHLQPVFVGCEYVGNGVAEALFRDGLCLPSGSNLSGADLERVVDVIRKSGGRFSLSTSTLIFGRIWCVEDTTTDEDRNGLAMS